MTNIADFVKLKDQIMGRNLDIGLIVINAGLLANDYLENLTASSVQALLDVNMYHPTAMLKAFLPSLIERK